MPSVFPGYIRRADAEARSQIEAQSRGMGRGANDHTKFYWPVLQHPDPTRSTEWALLIPEGQEGELEIAEQLQLVSNAVAEADEWFKEPRNFGVETVMAARSWDGTDTLIRAWNRIRSMLA